MGRGRKWTGPEYELVAKHIERGPKLTALFRTMQWPIDSIRKLAKKIRAGLAYEDLYNYAGRRSKVDVATLQEVQSGNPEYTAREVMERAGGGVGLRQVNKLLKQHFRAVKKGKVQLLTEKAKNARFMWCRTVIRRILISRGVRLRAPSKLRPLKLSSIWFSDEKLFRLAKTVNSQNSRVRVPLTTTKKSASQQPAYSQKLTIEKQQYNPGHMIGMLFNGIHGVSPPYVLPGDVKVDSKGYQKFATENYILWILARMPPKEAVFQDTAPSHKSKITRAFWADITPDMEILEWPANSPDLNPLDFAFWANFAEALPEKCTNKIDLYVSIFDSHRKLTEQLNPGRVLKEFEDRVLACLKAQGDHFEMAL